MKNYYIREDIAIKIDNKNKVYEIIKEKYGKKKDDRKDLLALIKTIKMTKLYELHVIQYMLTRKNNGIVNFIRESLINNELTLEDIIKYLENNVYFFINKNTLKDFDDKKESCRLYCLYGASKKIYVVIDYLNSGGNSNIFTCKQLDNNEIFVLKYIKRDINDSFRKEVETIINLEHKNIIKIIDYSDLENKDMKFYLTKKYKYSLHIYLFNRSIHYKLADFSIDSKINFMISIIDALECIQKNGFSHFDIKADNILFDDINEPVIADFGCAINLKKDKIIKDVNTKLGNHPNASPEQRNFPYTRYHDLEHSDIYSAGVVFNQLISGKSFEGTLDKKMYSKIDGYLSYLVWITTNMMANHPNERPSFSLVKDTLSLFKKIWNNNIKSVKNINLTESLNFTYRYEVPVMKPEPVRNDQSNIFLKKNEGNKGFIKSYKEKMDLNTSKSMGLFYDQVEEKIKLKYRKLPLNKNSAIGQIFAIPYNNNHEIKSPFCVKSFIVDKNENKNVLFGEFNRTIIMYLNTPSSNFFHLFYIGDTFNYYYEDIVEHYFYHHDDDLKKIYHSNKLFFKIVTFNDETKLLCFGEKGNKKLLFFVSGNKVFKLPPKYLEFLDV